jgi:hypothetical protein
MYLTSVASLVKPISPSLTWWYERWSIRNMKLLVTNFSPTNCYSQYFRSQNSPQPPLSNSHILGTCFTFCPQGDTSAFRPKQVTGTFTYLYGLMLMFLYIRRSREDKIQPVLLLNLFRQCELAITWLMKRWTGLYNRSSAYACWLLSDFRNQCDYYYYHYYHLHHYYAVFYNRWSHKNASIAL